MAAGDRYQLDISSVNALIRSWEGGAHALGDIAQQLATIHSRLESAVPHTLVEGLLAEAPLADCFARLAVATKAASTASRGLMQDTSTLERNLAAYEEAEHVAEARLKAVRDGRRSTGGGRTHISGRGPSSAGGGGGSPSGGRHGGSGSGPGSRSGHGGAVRGGTGGGGTSGVGSSGAVSSGSGSSGSGRGGGAGGGGTQPPGPALYADEEQVEQWINEAFEVLEADGVPPSELDEAGVLLIIEHESSGNPNAINNWDSNAQAGDPSRGLMQTIGTTFDAYKLPGHDDIYNPVDNIIAGVRYAISRYGSIQNVPGVKSVNNGGSYVGY